jgi:hypothetical protein
MSKQKNNGVAVSEKPVNAQPLLRINFDEIDSIEETPVESEPVQESAPGESIIGDSEEQVLSTVESFDTAFRNDPLAVKYREFGDAARAYADPVDATERFIKLGALQHDLMVAEHNLAPSSYDRAAVMKKCESALRACGVPESMVKPQEVTAIYWIVKLDLSKPGEEGEPRSFYDVAELLPDWLGGNLTVGVLRVLAKCLSRQSGNDEIDVWDYRVDYESWMHDKCERLHNGELSIRQVERLLDAKKKQLAEAKKREKFAGLTADEIASVESAEKNASLQSKLTELSSKALDVQKFAAEELKKGGADLKEFLANRGIIPAEKFITPQEYAAQMTPGDAKALVQALITLYPTKPDRMQVFKALYQNCKAVVSQIQSAAAQESKTAKVA